MVVAVPLFLISSNVRWVINAPLLYSYGFARYDIASLTGIERGELMSAARQIRDYFNNGREELDVRVAQGGVVRSIYNEREIQHMRDVKGLVRGVYRVQEISGAYMVIVALAGLVAGRRAFLRRLSRYLRLGAGLTLGLVAAVGVGSLLGFDRIFLAFHQVSFSNDLWQLDPSRDYLIMMFPEGFFLDATLWVAGSTVVEALLLLIGLYLLPRLARRGGRNAAAHKSVEAAGRLT